MEFVVFIPFSTYFSASKNPFMHPVWLFFPGAPLISHLDLSILIDLSWLLILRLVLHRTDLAHNLGTYLSLCHFSSLISTFSHLISKIEVH